VEFCGAYVVAERTLESDSIAPIGFLRSSTTSYPAVATRPCADYPQI